MQRWEVRPFQVKRTRYRKELATCEEQRKGQWEEGGEGGLAGWRGRQEGHHQDGLCGQKREFYSEDQGKLLEGFN